jgi:hypothetical protein
MRFLLLNNSEISYRWVVLIPDEPGHNHYLACLHVFETEIAARMFGARQEGVLVPGRPWVLTFSGVANSPRLPISYRYEEEIPEFLEQAAIFCASLTL